MRICNAPEMCSSDKNLIKNKYCSRETFIFVEKGKF